jgi:hypothetical protein
MSAALVMTAVIVSAASPSSTFAQTDESSSSENNTTSAENGNYTYVAQPGDSYTQMARKALQTYGIETNGEIGGAGILFAETNLTSLAGWPILNEGDTVMISKSSVKEWFDNATKLTAEEKANWEYYVPFVDFNTNSVGEAPQS